MQSLFAAADDFAELLEESGKSKRHGTSQDVYNKEKASIKQLAWEEDRHQKIHNKGKYKRSNWNNKHKEKNWKNKTKFNNNKNKNFNKNNFRKTKH